MTVVCVDDHSILLNGLAESVKQILPDANVNAFVSANAALAFVKENGCDILICEIDLYDMLVKIQRHWEDVITVQND